MAEWVEKLEKKRVLAISFAVLAGILAAILIGGFVSVRSYTFQGERLRIDGSETRVYKGERGSGSITMRDRQGNTLIATQTIQGGVGLNSDYITMEIAYAGKTIRSMSNGVFTERLVFSDGTVYEGGQYFIQVNDRFYDEALHAAQNEEAFLVQYLQAYFYEPPRAAQYVLGFLLGGAVLLLGLYMLQFPEKSWRWQTRWTVEGGEPTSLALAMNCAGGLLLILLVYGAAIGLAY